MAIRIAILAGLLGACAPDIARSIPQSQIWMPIEAHRTTPGLNGAWRSESTGHLIAFSDSGYSVFHEIDTLCLADSGQLPELALFQFDPQARRLAVHSYDYRAHPALLQNPLVLTRLEGLPQACSADPEFSGADLVVVFDALWSVFDRHYAFFDAHDVDWDLARDAFRPSALAADSPEALFATLSEMLAPLNDGHVNLSGAGKVFNAGRPRLRDRLAEIWRTSETDLSEGAFVAQWSRQVRQSIESVLVPGSHRTGADGALEWGQVTANTGYLRINRFSRFDSEATDRAAELDTLRNALEQFETDIGNVERVIVDVAHNGGGHDAAAMTIVQHFMDRPRAVLTYDVIGTEPRTVTLAPRDDYGSGNRSQREVLLVTSEITASAAEAFVLMMRALPHITHVGETTRGGLSSLLPKPLPLGFQVTVSYQRVLDSEGQLYEGRGIPPDRAVSLFPDNDIYGGYSAAIRQLAE